MSWRRELEELVESTLSILRRAGFIVETIVYPENKRSIDIVGTYNDRRVIIKVLLDCNKLTTVEINDLKKASMAYHASPLIVAEKYGKNKVEDDIVYVKKEINVVNNQTLEQYIVHNDKPLVTSIQGALLVRINSKKFRERRLELGYTLGEAASLIGVSRKAVYEYERGRSYISLEKAIRIAEVFGEDVLEPIDILDTSREYSITSEKEKPSSNMEKTLIGLASSKGYSFFKLLRTPVDYILSRKNIVLSIIRMDKDKEKTELKVEQAEKISRTMKTKPILIEEENDIFQLKDYI